MERAIKFDAALQSLCKPGPAALWLEGVADEVLAMPAARAVALRVEPSFTVSTASPLPSLSQESFEVRDFAKRRAAALKLRWFV